MPEEIPARLMWLCRPGLGQCGPVFGLHMANTVRPEDEHLAAA